MKNYRKLELTIQSANDLTKVGFLSKSLKPYVVVSLFDHSTSPFHYDKKTTPVDKTGNKNPTWNFRKKFTLKDAAIQSNRISLTLELFSRRTFLPDTLIGKLHVSVFDLFSRAQNSSGATHVSYEIRSKTTGKPKGVVNFSYEFGDAYPAPPQKVVRPANRVSGIDFVPMTLMMAMMSF